MHLFIGIEGISMRHSFAVAALETGKLVAEEHGEPISLHAMPREVLRDRLLHLLHRVAKRCGTTIDRLDDATVCIGLTGVTFPYDAKVDLPREFATLDIHCKNLICTGDAEIVFASHALCERGGVIICHSGSTGYAVASNRRSRFGGWGPALGDEGSGYKMGLAALRAIGEEYDSSEDGSVLWNRIQEWLLNPCDALPEWTEASLMWRRCVEEFTKLAYDLRTALFAFSHEMALTGRWRTIASGLAIPLMQAWRDGDPSAGEIVNKAAADLTHQLARACKVVNIRGNVPIVLYGGVFKRNKDFQNLVVEHLKREFREPPAILRAGDPRTLPPAFGALLFALANSTSRDLRLPRAALVEAIVSEHAIPVSYAI